MTVSTLKESINKILGHIPFWILIAVMCMLLKLSPAMALLAGAVIAIVFGNPRAKETSKIGKYLLQLSVVLLGFNMNLMIVLKVGLSSFGMTFVSIALTMIIGYFLGKTLKVDKDMSVLLSSGTSICGGSAIAAMSGAIGASSAAIAISMALVFILNGFGLVIFPALGEMLHLTQEQFGVWAALAIHDTSSVVGASAMYGSVSLAIATVIKLTRALWILPLSFFGAKFFKGQGKAAFPYFLLGFLGAAAINSFFPAGTPLWGALSLLGRRLMVGTLFFIGAGLSLKDLKKAGLRPVLMAVILWVIVSAVSLFFITNGFINLDFGGII